MPRRSPLTFLVWLFVVCVLLVAWSQRARGQGKVALPDSLALALLRPGQVAFNSIGAWFSDVGRVMVRRGDIIKENKGLRGRIADLENRNRRLLRYQKENKELRRLLKMPPLPGGRLVSADVVSGDATNYARRLIINAGARQGVRPKDVVFNAQGVLGQVIEVDRVFNTSTVLLLTDRMSGIGAMVQRTAARGLLQGNGSTACTMSYLDLHADVREGDLIVTSGDSTIFPKGLILGRVMRVRKNKTYSQTTAEIEPAAPVDQASAVLIRVQAGARQG
ncbi:MAG TPA: rod shape-determining protein MreC [Abditibacteriaceae bacterium]|jgi:rod shape-determining protein MreC